MGKLSSSSKKTKHSRDSSKLLSAKKKKKTTTKRRKSKKIRRLKDYSDENDSSGSDSSLYSTSEDDYRRKKLRSKASKKRSRKRYSSSDSDDSEDDYRILRKKKRSKRNEESVGKKNKKKVGSRKRRKRYSSSSSTSTESCSVQSDQSDDVSESDGKRRTGRLGKVKAVRRRSEDESEEASEPDECWKVEDEVASEKNSRRLKSIVVVSYSYDNDERKEDLMDESDEKKHLDDERYREGSTVSYPRSGADEDGCKTVAYNDFEEDTKSETSKYSCADNKLKDDELEALLKKRALENLKRFRGGMQNTGRASKEVSSASEGVLLTESERAQESLDHGITEGKISVATGSKDLETSQRVNVKESGTVLLDLASQQDQQPEDTAKLKVGSGINSCTTKRKLVRPVFGQESLNLASRKEVASCQDAEAESVNGGSTTDENCPENIAKTKASSTLNAQSPSHADTETLDDIKVGSQSEQKTMDEPKDELQYEQKTMTVMRGGEMVQVSYKVYIPKKTSSLGRRQLKR